MWRSLIAPRAIIAFTYRVVFGLLFFFHPQQILTTMSTKNKNKNVAAHGGTHGEGVQTGKLTNQLNLTNGGGSLLKVYGCWSAAAIVNRNT